MTPSLPKESSDGYPHPPSRGMETFREVSERKTVFLKENRLQKNRVVLYARNCIYTLLLKGNLNFEKDGRVKINFPFTAKGGRFFND